MSCGYDLLPDGVLLFKLLLFVDLVSESIYGRYEPIGDDGIHAAIIYGVEAYIQSI